MLNGDNSKHDKGGLRLSFDHPVYVSDISIRTILDKAFIEHKSYETNWMHSHPYYEMHICISGECRIQFLDGTDIIMKPSTICLIPPGVNHSTKKLGDDGCNLPICFTYKKTNKNCGNKKLYDLVHSELSRLTRPMQYFSEQIVGIANELRYETQHHSYASDVLEQLLLGQMYVWMFRLMLPYEGNALKRNVIAENPEVRYLRMDKYLNENFCNDITVEDVAKYVSVSKRHISRVFRKTYGMTFHEKLTDLRLVKAAEMLLHTDKTVGDIAFDVGYSSYSGFSIVFKRKYGMSAKQYRIKYVKRIGEGDV